MIKNSPNDCYFRVQKTTIVILDHLSQVLSHIASHSDRHQFNGLQSVLCATLQSILHKVDANGVSKISDSIMNALVKLTYLRMV